MKGVGTSVWAYSELEWGWAGRYCTLPWLLRPPSISRCLGAASVLPHTNISVHSGPPHSFLAILGENKTILHQGQVCSLYPRTQTAHLVPMRTAASGLDPFLSILKVPAVSILWFLQHTGAADLCHPDNLMSQTLCSPLSGS